MKLITRKGPIKEATTKAINSYHQTSQMPEFYKKAFKRKMKEMGLQFNLSDRII